MLKAGVPLALNSIPDEAAAMKKLLLFHFNLFLLTSLFTIKGFSQALPDPGIDPLAPPDTIAQIHTLKKDFVTRKETILLTASAIPSDQLANNEENSSAYKREEKAKQNSK